MKERHRTHHISHKETRQKRRVAHSREKPRRKRKEKHRLPKFKWIVAAGVVGIIAALSRDQRITQAFGASSWCDPNVPGSPAEVAGANVYYFPGELNSCPEVLEGWAHRYGAGEPLNTHTSSGEVFDPSGLTAASWLYPLGTYVRVTRLDDPTKSVVVRINDRGPNRLLLLNKYPEGHPYHKNVVIDLAAGAMRYLDPTSGALQVRVEQVNH